MKPLHAFLIAVAVGLLAALVPSCGPVGGQCNATTCNGCCSADDKCLPGTEGSACGSRGGYCVLCSAEETCSAGVCVVATQGNCSAANCTGCCQNGSCVPGTSDSACGSGGNSCGSCASGSSCNGGSCVSNACAPGCVDSSGNCQSGTTVSACGSNGASCQACPSGETCTNQTCVNTSCAPGCTDSSGNCQAGTTVAACGSGGASCQACPSGDTCTNQRCVNPACNGCRDSNGNCQPGTLANACGTGGATCQTCGSGQTCNSGVCVTTGGWDGGSGPITCPAPDSYNTSNGSSCGSWRWSVKTGTDPAAPSVPLTPVETTIKALGQLPVPSGLGSSTPRTGPENTVWLLRNITVVETKLESDSDYHVPIKDPVTGATMEAEIPFPKNCVGSGSPFFCFITHARNTLEKVVMPTGSYQQINQTATIIGPALFDMLHGSASAAPNGIEIHPILAICFGQDCNPLAN